MCRNAESMLSGLDALYVSALLHRSDICAVVYNVCHAYVCPMHMCVLKNRKVGYTCIQMCIGRNQSAFVTSYHEQLTSIILCCASCTCVLCSYCHQYVQVLRIKTWDFDHDTGCDVQPGWCPKVTAICCLNFWHIVVA